VKAETESSAKVQLKEATPIKAGHFDRKSDKIEKTRKKRRD